jgi:hypothetical protein
MSKIDTTDAAQKLALAIITRILSYSEDKIIEGIENDNLFTIMKSEFEKGRDLYNSRVSEEILNTSNFFDEAIVDLIIYEKGKTIKSNIW